MSNHRSIQCKAKSNTNKLNREALPRRFQEHTFDVIQYSCPDTIHELCCFRNCQAFLTPITQSLTEQIIDVAFAFYQTKAMDFVIDDIYLKSGMIDSTNGVRSFVGAGYCGFRHIVL